MYLCYFKYCIIIFFFFVLTILIKSDILANTCSFGSGNFCNTDTLRKNLIFPSNLSCALFIIIVKNTERSSTHTLPDFLTDIERKRFVLYNNASSPNATPGPKLC